MKAPLTSVAVAIAALALAACSSGPEGTSPSASPSATPSPSVTPSATPSASPTPTETAVAFTCPTWTDDPDAGVAAIGPNYFAGACLGESFDGAAANGAAVTVEASCPWYGTLVADDSLGFYVSTITEMDTPGESITLFRMSWFTDPADAAGLDMPSTAEGITIGSTEAQVLAAYPTATEVSFDDISRGPRTQLVVETSADTSYNFDITDGLVNEISWGYGISEGGPNGELCAL
jgi:hypothetical protein